MVGMTRTDCVLLLMKVAVWTLALYAMLSFVVEW